jgi:hypothetical protein
MNEGTGLLHSIEMSNILNWNYKNNYDFDRNIRNNSVLFTLIAQIVRTIGFFHACVFILSGSKVLSVFRETVLFE